ncbi:recombinase family protein [Butyricicoccus faecihominis]|uniref:recombinase family protein n=1 Tax=Butyricicoccus faecihominis TaxID=1712515 RepID=UPI00247AF486|nr:recombinase family protein [Butyricicoccus faecihominis]MCQ5128138.1 recombinase family protein [Butyricicoccus faecihominis]
MALRVAAYCRVSTDQDDQLNSLQNQKRYFEEYINRQTDWKLYAVFADEGLSGTSSQNRPAFQQMMAAARAGEIDLILTKEVSRFARNTVDTLAHTRELSKRGVGVVFINDNIDTRQNDGEFRLTIMASVAQEESRKTSERVKWGQKRSMENGVVFGCNNMYGYELKNGKLFVRRGEDEVVRLIFHKFLNEGKGTHVIARELYEAGIAPPKAKDKPWSAVMILRILRNEKYCGDLRQKKSYTPNYLDHRKVLNDGKEGQVYLRDHHEAIVPREMFERVQEELKRRAPTDKQKGRYSNRYWCSGKIFCGCCGARFVPKNRERPGGFVYRVWVCHAKGHFGNRKLDAQGKVVGCNMRSVNDRTVCACMEYLVGLLRMDFDRVIDEVIGLVHGTEAEQGAEELDGLLEQQKRLLEKKDAVLDAYFEGTITKDEMERLRAKYDTELERAEKRLSTLNRLAEDEAKSRHDLEELRGFLKKRGLQSEALFGELLDKMTVQEDNVTVRLNGLPVVFWLRYETSGLAEEYRTEITECEIVTEEQPSCRV